MDVVVVSIARIRRIRRDQKVSGPGMVGDPGIRPQNILIADDLSTLRLEDKLA